MPAPQHKPTDEQQNAIDLFTGGRNTVIDALAGSGKTSTLQMIAHQAGRRRGLYAAFNKAIALDAGRKFQGTTVTAKTVHSLAFAQFGAPMRDRLGNKRPVQWSEKARILGINDRYLLPPDHGSLTGAVSRQQLVGMATNTVKAYMQSTAEHITGDLVELIPSLAGLKEKYEVQLRETVAAFAERYWDDLTRPDGQLRYDHGAYFKQFALSRPTLPYDFIMLDEAQDSDPLTVQIISEQTSAQVVTVGDAYQSIYGWRGATNAMDSFNGDHAALTLSFRFGDQIADYANRWLDLLGGHLRLRGMPGFKSSVWRTEKRVPEAILTRTNAGAIWEIVRCQDESLSTGIAGESKAKEIRDLARAAVDLQERGATDHPELSAFNTWPDAVEYAQSDEGEDLRPLVDVIEKYTARKVVRAVEACVPTENAEVTVSTAHVSKGLEWIQVRIAEDFHPPRQKKGVVQPMPSEEARLAYVASTRAQRHLDPRGFEWLDEYLASGGWVEGNPGGASAAPVVSGETVHVGEVTTSAAAPHAH
ncbi:MAG: ATP-dependent helicase [Microbacterium sp.]|uniref:UvrD-helicase domain-containing protein n=1 Tax=Microbacterium sp. TaxID=51671 RepID=UPI001AD5583E|nr:UvrD-helicase domain-containing protein [Microbacterium sp.]MBN9214114.1 ATP-dependent helicase [Microbacterium sp.]